jgi:hypothetical protein
MGYLHTEEYRSGEKEYCQNDGRGFVYQTGRDRPELFPRMERIVGGVQNIVNDVRGAGSQAKCDYRECPLCDYAGMKQYAPQKRREKEHQVFEPLGGAEEYEISRNFHSFSFSASFLAGNL